MTSIVSRNKVKLQMYQREYAWWKQAPGCRKINKAECVLLEEQQVQKLHLMKMKDLPVHPRAAFDRLQCLVASAVQEVELVQQHEYATSCIKLDRAIVWDGQAYVMKLICHFLASLICPELI
ncbi:hypothetical protein EI94DRAFT_1703475 [Lactarius quietus]|nr:hypothetical protein EI94DRAFT_1703475 [Lactarius quietus]